MQQGSSKPHYTTFSIYILIFKNNYIFSFFFVLYFLTFIHVWFTNASQALYLCKEVVRSNFKFNCNIIYLKKVHTFSIHFCLVFPVNTDLYLCKVVLHGLLELHDEGVHQRLPGHVTPASDGVRLITQRLKTPRTHLQHLGSDLDIKSSSFKFLLSEIFKTWGRHGF